MRKIYILCLLLITLFSCSEKKHRLSDTEDNTEEVIERKVDPSTLQNGWNFTPNKPKANESLLITYKAEEGDPFYNLEGDLYLHSGVNSAWTGAPKWKDNSERYRLKAVEGQKNIWAITLSPSIAAYYNVEAEKITRVNLVLRSADGKKQTGDYFVLVGASAQNFDAETVKKAPLPTSIKAPLEGIHIHSTTEVTFVLYDKDGNGKRNKNAFLLTEQEQFKPSNKNKMFYDEAKSCWWFTAKNLKAGENLYQYLLVDQKDGIAYFADPYAKTVLEKGSKFSKYPAAAGGHYVGLVDTQKKAYNWAVPNFQIKHSNSLVIYELLLRDFTEQHNLKGAIEKLPYLKKLGVNAIELMPVQEFDGDNSWGYNTAYYFALDRAYGSSQEYKEFIDLCHKEGLAVILDVVYNHTTNNNPFAKIYWDTNKKRPAEGNPYLNVETPHKKYVFSPNDFNHQSARTQEFVIRNLHYLLDEYKFDGFRFDFTKGFTQRQTSGDSDLAQWDQDRIDVLKKYAKAVTSKKSDAVVIMEHLVDAEEKALASAGIKSWRNVNHNYCQAAMGYSSQSNFYGMAYENMNSVAYMESHDEERMGYKQVKWGLDVIKNNDKNRMQLLAMNAIFSFTVPGNKMIWQFGELGYSIGIDTNERTGMKPTGWKLLDKPNNKNVLEVYQALLELRNQHPDMFDGSAEFKWEVGDNNWNNGRWLSLRKGDKELIVLGNYTAKTIRVHFMADERKANWKDFFSKKGVSLRANESLGIYTAPNGLGVDIKLAPFSYKVYSRNL